MPNKKIAVQNTGAPKNFENLITEIAEDVIDDVYTYPYLKIILIAGPQSIEDVESSEIPIFAIANTFGFLRGEEPIVKISTTILWYGM